MEISNAKRAAEAALAYTKELVPNAKYAALEGIELYEIKFPLGRSRGLHARGRHAVFRLNSCDETTYGKRTYKKLALDAITLELKTMMPYDVSRATRS